METGRRHRVRSDPRFTGDGVALCVIGRRENRYAREFVSHYKALGFDRVFICDNNRDGEERFEDVLGDYIEDGFVTVLDYRGKAGVQRQAYGEVYARYGGKYRWMAFFDFDEFLHIVSGAPIGDLMRNYVSFDCVLLNWMNYGDNGLVTDDGRDLSERFTEPLPLRHSVQYEGVPDNDHVKCIVRGGLPLVEFADNPHLPSNAMRCCDSMGVPCRQRPFHGFNHSVAFLRHYVTKTAEEWFSGKWSKGTGNMDSIEDFRNRYAGRFFSYNEWTQEKEDVMRRVTGMPPRKDPMHRNVVIVNYNTQALTEAAIRSLNRHTPGCRVAVFDNSDRYPFENRFSNVEVIDNTEGGYIDFGRVLAEYPDKYPTPENDYASAKHCMTVDFCFDLFPDGFLLMDSDVLVESDVTPLFDASCAWTGKVEIHSNRANCRLPRVLPYLCYVNVPLLRSHGVRYFNGEKMWALNRRYPDMWYDTGCWFYEECHRLSLPESHVNIDAFIIHLRHGSWIGSRQDEWLDAHSELWK